MRIARVFFDCDMRVQFQGVRKFLAENKIDSRLLGQGDLIVFMNRATTAFKVLAGNDYLVYYNHHRKIPLEAIQYLPTYFGADTEFEFTKAIEHALLQKLARKRAHRLRKAS